MFDFAHSLSALRDAITQAYRMDESTAVKSLAQQATLDAQQRQQISDLARRLVTQVRQDRSKASGVDALMHEFSLSSEEGVALMCLAEALLRIPDNATRDKLIKDKLADGDWQSHIGHSPSMFVNAAAWGLLITGKLSTPTQEKSLGAALTRVLQKGGEPFIRSGVNYAMKMLGKQFVTGQTIEEALNNGKAREQLGYRFSFDMLGEAAMTQADADRYYQDYISAIHAIGKDNTQQGKSRGVYDGNGISVKLSAIHPRYARTQHQRVMDQLLPRLKQLFLLAKQYDIGLNIDAEEANRLELSLDLMEQLVGDADLKGFQGIGFVVQAYQKRCPYVIDYLIDLARRHGQRLMIRLVKGAYWDSEIKWAQVDGMDGYPVYTRKVHTDIAYLACAKKLLTAQDAIFPQFASHNAYTLAAIYELAGGVASEKNYEFQCLHGMGETLYDQVVGEENLGRRVRIYAPVGTHKTLLAYLVRRLLENGANSSFVNRIVDDNVSIDELVQCPLDELARTQGELNGLTPAPRFMYANQGKDARLNSFGLDLSNEHLLQQLQQEMNDCLVLNFDVQSILAPEIEAQNSKKQAVVNPANPNDIVGMVNFASVEDAQQAVTVAVNYQPVWANVSVTQRADYLRAFADVMEQRMALLMMVAIREAGKTMQNAIAEVREAVDFCRYYAVQAEQIHPQPLGAVVAISPWNFPLAIFVGEVVSALVAGNTVLAKPAEQTSLMAHLAVEWLHEVGVPRQALQLVLGAGDIGAALTQDPRIQGVIFTGSTDVAKRINQTLSQRSDQPVLIAETGGQNAMIVDSTALPEQVCADVLNSAFDSAGQRCSALRVLCLQEDIADHMLEMLRGAMDELVVSDPSRLNTDIGPVIDAEAQQNLLEHIKHMKSTAKSFHEIELKDDLDSKATFVKPIMFELNNLAELKKEVFGPVLHVMRFAAGQLDKVIDEINGKGYALTHGVHSRIDSTIEHIQSRIQAGNVYINRNIVGAVVGVQPFGGHGLSGTGPKAGGPFYLQRLSKNPLWTVPTPSTVAHLNVDALMKIEQALASLPLSDIEMADVKSAIGFAKQHSLHGASIELKGPTGEINTLSWHMPKHIYLHYENINDCNMVNVVKAMIYTSSNHATLYVSEQLPCLSHLKALKSHFDATSTEKALNTCDNIITFKPASSAFKAQLANVDGAIRKLILLETTQNSMWNIYPLYHEVSTSINTTAAGGNASLMAEQEL
ncbi:bifunctional proline dehydrogenase/L-glutamate gamma-semialdehyde dehydrogenase PutA [Acinetobacter sp. c2-A9]|uniref:bifunctional proline dehydrogenase/L-glutamate gamma-semialdehyde dehydrogenase PutA n=1 Tax=Acinetobacter sp. c2-A9 TaxID=3342802 RepID=UPI0035B86A4B